MSTITSVSNQISFLPSTQTSSKALGVSGKSNLFELGFLGDVNEDKIFTGSNVGLWEGEVNSAFAQTVEELKKNNPNWTMGEALEDAINTKISFVSTDASSTLAGGKLSINPNSNQLTLASGVTLDLPFINGGNFRVTEGENGTVTVVTDMLRVTYDKDGNRINSERGSFDPLTGTENNDYIVNRTGTQVNAGGGDDIIFQFSKSATIRAGAGDDEIVFGDTVFDKLSIDLGEGNDTIESLSLRVNGDLDISAGDGDDTIKIGTLQATNITLDSGDGDDTIQIASLMASNFNIDGGEGNNIISIVNLLGDSEKTTNSISAGNGNNEISISKGVFKGNILVGDGNNTISLDQTSEATIQGGYGQNTVNITTAYLSSVQIFGEQADVDIKDNQKSTVSIAEEKAMITGALVGQVLDSIWNEQKQDDETTSPEKTKYSEDTTARLSRTPSQRSTLMFKDDMAQQIENVLAQSIEPSRLTLENKVMSTTI